MAITTLVDYWQQEVTAYTAAKAGAQAALTAAQAGLATAKKQRDQDVDALAKKKTDIAAKRAKLSTSKVPAEVDALNRDIRDLNEQRRVLEGAILDDQDLADDWQAQLDVAAATLARATARLDGATGKLADAQTAASDAAALKVALGQPPFDTLKADATGFLAGAVATDAKTQLKGTDFPSPLFDRAQTRYATRAQRLTSLQNGVTFAQTGLGTTAGQDGGLEGAADKARIVFEQAERACRQYAGSAKLRYDRAVSTLTTFATMKANPDTDFLTADERNLVKPNQARTTAEADVGQIDTDRRAVDTAREQLEAKIITQIGAAIDTLPTDPGVLAGRAAVVTAVTKVQTSVNTFAAKGTEPKDLADWEAIYGDGDWHLLLDYFDAAATLTELSGITPTGANSLVEAWTNAETAYAAALAAAAQARRRRAALNDEIDVRQARRDAAAAAAPSRVLSAIRGDSY